MKWCIRGMVIVRSVFLLSYGICFDVWLSSHILVFRDNIIVLVQLVHSLFIHYFFTECFFANILTMSCHGLMGVYTQLFALLWYIKRIHKYDQKLIFLCILSAMPPFVNRMDFMPKFSQLSYHKQVSKQSTFFRNYVEFHFVIWFYYIWNAKCGRFHGLFQVLLFMHNNKGGHNQNWLTPVFWLSKVDKLKWFHLQLFLRHKRCSCALVKSDSRCI